MKRTITPIDLAITLGCAAVILGYLVGLAKADDFDSRWIKSTIWQSRAEALREGHVVPRWRHYRQRYHRYRDRDHDDDRHHSTRVYGMVTGGPQRVQRDATSHVQCWPPLEHTGGEHASEDRAWNEAQLGWMGAVAAKYGARFADVQNVDARTLRRQCFRTSFNDSWAGRNIEAAKQAVGLTGFKVRCIIIASPCMAPTANDTPLKGDDQR